MPPSVLASLEPSRLQRPPHTPTRQSTLFEDYPIERAALSIRLGGPHKAPLAPSNKQSQVVLWHAHSQFPFVGKCATSQGTHRRRPTKAEKRRIVGDARAVGRLIGAAGNHRGAPVGGVEVVVAGRASRNGRFAATGPCSGRQANQGRGQSAHGRRWPASGPGRVCTDAQSGAYTTITAGQLCAP